MIPAALALRGVRDNRLFARSEKGKQEGGFVRIDTLQLTDKQTVRGWLKGFDQEVLIARQVFTNKDGSTGILNLVCSDLTLDGEQVTTIYKKRWKVAEKPLLRFPHFRHPWRSEEFHKSLKSNAALAKSPTRTVTTQNNHVFMSFYAVFKLECLKLKLKLNHFALRMKLYVKATQQAYRELQAMRAA